MSKYQVIGKRKGNVKVRQFHCRADADEFREGCNWDDARVELVETGGENQSEVSYERCVRGCARRLEHLGYDVLEQCWKRDDLEIDIIARDDETLVFVDVSASECGAEGFGIVKVDEHKVDEWERAAIAYLQDFDDGCDITVRFDMMQVVVTSGNRALVKHYVNAVTPWGR